MTINNPLRLLLFKISFFLFCFGAMCDTMLFTDMDIGIFHINVETPKTGIIIYILVFFLAGDFKIRNVFSKFDKTVLLILALIFLSGFISSYRSPEQERAFRNLLHYFSYFICFVITLKYIYRFKDAANYILKCFLFINLILMFSSLLDFYIPSFNQLLIDKFSHWELKHSFFSIDGVKYLRPAGFVSDTNLTAFSIALGLLLVIINYNKFRNKYLAWGYIILSGYIFGMLGSRSSLVMILICGALFLIFRKVNYRIVLKILLVFFAVQLLTPQTRVRIEQLFDKKYIEEEAAIGRPLIWKAAFLAFKEHKINGLGPGIFFVQSIDYLTKAAGEGPDRESFDKMEKHNVNPHNIFLVFLSEQGIMGFILFIAFLLYLFYFFFKSDKKLSLIFLIGILIISSLSNYAPYFKYYIILCIVVYCLNRNEFSLEETKIAG